MNDSGNAPVLHLVDPRGRLLASIAVPGATNRDWEDLASGPRPGGRRWLYIADIGDNDLVRDDLVIYRVPEPAPDRRSTARAVAFPFRYPDGRHNAEAVFVDPASGRIHVVTKGDVFEAGAIYRFPLPLQPGRSVTLERVGGDIAREVEALPPVTGAALSRDGTRLAIRTYTDALEWRRPRTARFEALFSARPEFVALAPERQGEAIAYSTNGRALVTTSEQLPAPLWRVTRTGS